LADGGRGRENVVLRVKRDGNYLAGGTMFGAICPGGICPWQMSGSPTRSAGA